MSIVRADTGHDVPLVSLDRFPQDPKSTPVTPVERNYGLGGAIHDQGGWVALTWDFVDDEAAYLAILTHVNLHLSNFEAITIYLRDERLQWKRYNGYAQLPLPQTDMDWQNLFPRNITIHVVDLEELAEP